MFIFIRLLLAHLVGDFLLQFDKIYALKLKGLRGTVPHILLIVACMIAFSWPYLNLAGMWGFIFFIGITHLFQDSIKVGFKKIKYSFWLYLFDQFLHIALIATLFFTGLKNLPPPKYTHTFVTVFYNNDFLVLYLIAIIIVTYNGFYMIRSFKMAFLRKAGRYKPFERWYGMLERAVIVSIFAFGGFLFFLVPLAPFLRFPVFRLSKKKLGIRKRFISVLEMSLSWAIAVTTGIVFYIIISR